MLDVFQPATEPARSIEAANYVAMLSWSKLKDIEVPSDAKHPEFNSVDLTTEGIADLPAPLNEATCWIYCHEAWPHIDMDYEGVMFVTIAVQADHSYSQLDRQNKRSVLPVFPGQIFVTDPLCLHWLSPNSDSSPSFVGLQYEVPYYDLSTFLETLERRLGVLGEVRNGKLAKTDALLTPTAEYIGAPPAPG